MGYYMMFFISNFSEIFPTMFFISNFGNLPLSTSKMKLDITCSITLCPHIFINHGIDAYFAQIQA